MIINNIENKLKKIVLLWVAIAAILSPVLFAQNSTKVTIVVAANLKPAMDSILAIYKSQYPKEVVQVIYGASGKLYEQIINGAPFDIFFSADMGYPEKLKEKKLISSVIKLYAIGQLAIWSKKINPATKQMNSLIDVGVKKVAIANPSTAPYGARAVESLIYYKLYDKIKPNLVYGENIAQAAQFAAFGAADVAIVALSECLAPNMKKESGKYWIIPAKSHKPLEQGCVILKYAQKNTAATKFFDFISNKAVINILYHYGYTCPENK